MVVSSSTMKVARGRKDNFCRVYEGGMHLWLGIGEASGVAMICFPVSN